MKQILVLGAGQSAPYCIAYLLEHAAAEDWFVTVGDIDVDLARRRLDGHPRGSAVRFDVNDSSLRTTQFENADVVVSMLPPQFIDPIAWECIDHGCHLISVSYRNKAVRDLDVDAHRHGLLLLSEMGLDPGIDHMSATALIRRVRDDGGRITSFCSYGSGIPAPDQPQNPLRYLITWNPRNVAMAGEKGAQYMENGEIKIVPYPHVFHHTWTVEVDGVGTLEAYPNRDSLSYMDAFGLTDVKTMIRGTLRYPGWSETWSQIVKLGLPTEHARIPDLAERTYREVVEMFLPLNVSGPKMETRVARFLGISPTGRIIENMRWLGLFSDEKIGCEGETPADMLIHVLNRRMGLTDELRDVVVLVHELEVEYPEDDRPKERITSTLVAEGEAGGFTAMAKTVGLPAAIAVRLLLRDELHLTGSRIPTHPSIYDPILREIADEGLKFREEREVMSDEG
ncbi:MAG: saccharopine dehydrogenase C-terminal domain-containing protein [Planctomycetota bacterium]|nr:saccharopine dehydrogenase C-terminal domain-containing protein [Planctomycetota bacterium]